MKDIASSVTTELPTCKDFGPAVTRQRLARRFDDVRKACDAMDDGSFPVISPALPGDDVRF